MATVLNLRSSSAGQSWPRASRASLLLAGLSLVAGALAGSCGGGGGGGGGSDSQMDLVEVSNGFGRLVPHQVFELDSSGNPSSTLISIRSDADLAANVTLQNPVLPVTEWPPAPELPSGDPGNHFLYAQFTQPIKVKAILDSSPGGQTSFGLLGPILVVAVDPSTGQALPVAGRSFIGGKTFAPDPANPGGQLELQKWVGLDSSGKPVAKTVHGALPGLGFPGTESAAFSGGAQLLATSTFVFVVDSDGDLTTHETFPSGRQIRLSATTAVLSTSFEELTLPVLGSATVGGDSLSPEVELTPPPNSLPVTVPAFGDSDVEPTTTVTISFTEPLQPLSVGSLPTGKPPSLSSAISITFGPATKVTTVPFTALPASIYDFSKWVLTPTYAFPGSGPVTAQCGAFNVVSVDVKQQQLRDLSVAANTNFLPAGTNFSTGEGPGLVNAPIVPDAIVAIRQGSFPGLSVIDLNGFGQGTGNPAFDLTYTSFPKGNSNFPNNPNFKLQGNQIRPQIFLGTCTVDGGSEGVFTLTRDSSLNTMLLTAPLITSASDVMIGQSLDRVINNAKDPSGCKSQGGNICAINGKKFLQICYPANASNNYLVPCNDPIVTTIQNANSAQGGPNPVSWAPHPNPPALTFPPLCVEPYVGAQEPTSFYTAQLVILGGLQLPNLLKPGNPFGQPLTGKPPDGLLVELQNTYFQGPDLPSKLLPACFDHMHRQQIGHFLYLIDRARREIVVVNSNRMQVLDRLDVSDPTDLAMSPNLDYLAVSNQKSGLVQFIDIDPTSSNFHQVVKATQVGSGPRGIAWDPGNEDILVCNEADSSVSVISAFTFTVRKTVKSQLVLPFDVVITQRQNGFGYLRNVYFGWIINRNGNLAIFESGPSGINGWGFDDIIGVAPMKFSEPKKISVDFKNLGGGCWIAHQDALDFNGQPTGSKGGAISNVVIESATFGQLSLSSLVGNLFPQFRDLDFKVQTSISSDQLTGIPVDLAQDDQINLAAQVNFFGQFNPFTSAVPISMNGKSYVRRNFNNIVTGSKFPRFLFAAVPNSTEGPGVVDVFNIDAGGLRFDTDAYTPGVQSIPVPFVSAVVDYWRQ